MVLTQISRSYFKQSKFSITQISRSRFQQTKICMLISHIYVSGCFVHFLVYLVRNIFSERISKISGYGNLEDLMLF